MGLNKLRINFKKELNNSLEVTEWVKNEVLKCFDRAAGIEKDECPLCGDGCNCKGEI